MYKTKTKMWQIEADWDEELPFRLSQNLRKFHNINQLQIQRRIAGGKHTIKIQLHAFCGYPQSGYGTYLLKSS
jgi:hypothetical protein